MGRPIERLREIVGFPGLARLQRTPQRLDGSRPFASCQQRRNRLHQSHQAVEFTLRDVMNDRPVPVHFGGTRVSPPSGRSRTTGESRGTRSATAAGSPLSDRGTCLSAWRQSTLFLGLADRQRFGRTGGTSPSGASTSSVTIDVCQSREHVADRSVDRRARLVSNRSTTRLRHALTAPHIRFNCHRLSLRSET